MISHFGEPDETASLIRRAKRRGRPYAWKTAYAAFVSIGVIAALVAGAYLSRAATLYMQSSATGSGMSAEAVAPLVAETTARWQLQTPNADGDATLAIGVENTARDAVLSGASDRFYNAIMSMYEAGNELRARGSVAGEIEAARIELAASNALIDAVTEASITFSSGESAVLEAILTQPVRLDGVRSAFDRLLDAMYTKNFEGNGHLTGAGIEIVRQLKKWHQPSIKDRLMEPVWYALPASRRAVELRFEEAVQMAELSGPQRLASDASALALLQPVAASMWECLRYPAISAVMPQLTSVFAAREEANRARAKALLVLRILSTS